MKKRMKQMLSGFLALTMTVGGLPTSVLAEELILDEGEESAVVSESLLAGVGEDESGNGLQIVGCEEVGQSAETELWTGSIHRDRIGDGVMDRNVYRDQNGNRAVSEWYRNGNRGRFCGN